MSALPIVGACALVSHKRQLYARLTEDRRQGAKTLHGGQGGVVTLGAFRERADEIILHINRFLIRYLRSLAVEFEDDLEHAILLGEIGHHGRNVPP